MGLRSPVMLHNKPYKACHYTRECVMFSSHTEAKTSKFKRFKQFLDSFFNFHFTSAVFSDFFFSVIRLLSSFIILSNSPISVSRLRRRLIPSDEYIISCNSMHCFRLCTLSTNCRVSSSMT